MESRRHTGWEAQPEDSTADTTEHRLSYQAPGQATGTEQTSARADSKEMEMLELQGGHPETAMMKVFQ